jgi:hypothetical protein
MNANTITVSLLMVGGDNFSRNPALDWPLGQLPPGTYEVEVVKRSANGVNQGLVGRASFVVTPRLSSGPMFNFTDLYWNPQESGWGVSVTQVASGGLFLLWFVYGADHEPLWYFVSSGAWKTARHFAGTVYRSRGSPFSGPYDSGQFSASPVGTAEIFFDAQSYESATLVYTIEGISSFKNLVRQRL